MLGLYPYPIAGNIANTGDRLQRMVDITGFPVVASDLLLQRKKTIFDMKARQANQPCGDVYRDMSLRRGEFFAKIADSLGATVRVGMGDSLGVSAIQGMQLHKAMRPPFDAILLRDGWNLNRPISPIFGIARYIGYQARDFIQQRVQPPNFDIPETPYKHISLEPSEVNPIKAMYNVSDLMKGTDNRDNAVDLAGFPRLAMNVVCFDRGLSGSKKNQETFIDELIGARQQRTLAGDQNKLIAEIQPGWHHHLLDPIRGAADVERTLDLLS